jgi:hypothetical protein
MKTTLLKFCALSALFTAATFISMTGFTADNTAKNGPTVQILMEKDASGHLQPQVVNSMGEKTNLTLATFLAAIAETWITGKAEVTPKDKLDPNAVAYIRIDRSGNHADAKLYDFAVSGNAFRKDREEEATLGVLLGQAAQAYPGCTIDQINGKEVDLKLTFKKNANGVISTYVKDPSTGKEKEFNLGVMLADVTEKLNNCK